MITTEKKYDVIIIGGGPGGLAAASAAKKNGAKKVLLIERNVSLGGILNQCIHDGFGLFRYHQALTGPEYARKAIEEAIGSPAGIASGETSASPAGLPSDETSASPAGLPSVETSASPAGLPSDETSASPAGIASGETSNFPDGQPSVEIHNSESAQPSGENLGSNVDVLTDTMVINLTADKQVTAVNKQGLHVFEASAIVLATGCRERTKGNIPIPGTRPAGVYTAGVVQNLVNMKNIMVGKRVVILGSGDIGLIMARRLTLEGAKVLCVTEFLPDSGGLQRNIQQCLYDYDIPIYTRHSVSQIIGKKKLEAVEISEVDENGEFIPGTENRIECDTLVLSIGLIPENELAQGAGVELNPKNNGAITDDYLMTSVPGIFSCGNCRSVMDLADFVSNQGEVAGYNAAAYAKTAILPTASLNDAASMKKWAANDKYRPRKGIPEKGSLICVRCPKGCCLTYTADGGVEGNTCDKGLEYALQEKKEPKRVLTTTQKEADGSLIPVRTSQPIPLAKIKEYAGRLEEIDEEFIF